MTTRIRVEPLLEVTEQWLIVANQVTVAGFVLLLGFGVATKGLGRLVG